MDIIDRRESRVRTYSRSFPKTFVRAKGSCLYDADGKRYIDFLSGAGSLNYGHNDELQKRAIIDYLERDGVTHSLDRMTEAKSRFLERFEEVILHPRKLDYRVQFTGPTGANAIEAALKIARKAKQRSNVVGFTNAFHGLSGSGLALVGQARYRNPHYSTRASVTILPFDGYMGQGIDTVDYFRKLLEDPGSGLDLPAAVILETVQADGGVNVARTAWLQKLAELCRTFDILLIVDDIQVGTGRTGTFFSFEDAGIEPDIVVLAKSISGFGLPMSLVLLKDAVDRWEPGEHTGTFRGNNLAFVGATVALEHWRGAGLTADIGRKGELVKHRLAGLREKFPRAITTARGKGLIHGMEVADPKLAPAVREAAFPRGLMLECCGAHGQVLKILPPLVIEDAVLAEGMDILEAACTKVFAHA